MYASDERDELSSGLVFQGEHLRPNLFHGNVRILCGERLVDDILAMLEEERIMILFF